MYEEFEPDSSEGLNSSISLKELGNNLGLNDLHNSILGDLIGHNLYGKLYIHMDFQSSWQIINKFCLLRKEVIDYLPKFPLKKTNSIISESWIIRNSMHGNLSAIEVLIGKRTLVPEIDENTKILSISVKSSTKYAKKMINFVNVGSKMYFDLSYYNCSEQIELYRNHYP